MNRRRDPPGYPGDEYIARRFYEMKELLRQNAGMTREQLEKALAGGREKALQDSVVMRRAMGIKFRALREERKLSRAQVAHQSNVPLREIGRMERGSSSFSLADTIRLCLALKYDILELITETSGPLTKRDK